MQSIITRFSIVNARGGSVSQDIEFLEVEEARKLLFASTMKDDRQLKDNIRHHEFPLNLFNIQPSLLTNVLYGENGSGKTTFLTLMQDVGSFVRAMFVKPKAWASDEDLVDWHQGRIPKVYQSPSNPSLLNFEDLNDNLVVQSIRSAMKTRRLTKKAFDKAINMQTRMKSSFSLKMEGIFSPSELEIETHSGDMKFTCEIKPIAGFAWEENTRLRKIDNFVGSYYIIHIRLDAFENDYSANIAKNPNTALLDITEQEGEYHPYWAEYNIPILVHPSEGVLRLGSTVINPDIDVSEEFRWEDDSFEYQLDGDGKLNPDFSLFYNLVVGKGTGDLDLIEKGEISSPGCEFFRHAAVYALDGFPGDFFLCPTEEIVDYKTGEVTVTLPSLTREDHFQLWHSIFEHEHLPGFDVENPYGTGGASFDYTLWGNYYFIENFTKSLSSVYSFSPDYTPKPVRVDIPDRSRFYDRFVNDDPLKYLHLLYTLNPPETAMEGVIDYIKISKDIPGNLEQQLDMLVVIHGYLGNKSMGVPWIPMLGINSLLVADGNADADADAEAKTMFEEAMEYYATKYAELGYNEDMQEGAAKSEIKNFIVDTLEYLWFEAMPKEVANRKPKVMNALLEKHLGLTTAKPEGAGSMFGRGVRGGINFSPDNIWSLKSKKKIKLEHLSSGQHNLFMLISILGSEGDGPILIDEPELSLHMDWQLAMKDIVQSLVNHSKRQVFIASHSPDVILKFDDRSFPLLGEEVSDIDA